MHQAASGLLKSFKRKKEYVYTHLEALKTAVKQMDHRLLNDNVSMYICMYVFMNLRVCMVWICVYAYTEIMCVRI